eukprot:scaffold66924_cov18-Tisochrysis_lutea.AAC.1
MESFIALPLHRDGQQCARTPAFQQLACPHWQGYALLGAALWQPTSSCIQQTAWAGAGYWPRTLLLGD